MNTHADKTQENKNQSLFNETSHKQNGSNSTFQFVDNRPEAIAQRKLQEMANNSQQVSQLKAFQGMANNDSQAKETVQLQAMADNKTSKIQSNSNGEVMQMMFGRTAGPMLKGAGRFLGGSMAFSKGLDVLDKSTSFATEAFLGDRTKMESKGIGVFQSLLASRFPIAAPLINSGGYLAEKISDANPLETESEIALREDDPNRPEFQDERNRLIPDSVRDVSSVLDVLEVPTPLSPLISIDNLQSRLREYMNFMGYNSESLGSKQEEDRAQISSEDMNILNMM